MPLARFARLDAGGGVVTPGLVDPHTHLLFAGSRENELVLRQGGAGYLEILAAGGGILSTVAATRQASEEELAAHGRRWLDEMLRHGVTSIEAKSGYGLDLPTELRLLAVAHELGREGPIDVLPTFLGAHAVPPEFRARPGGTEAYVRSVIEEQLPGVAAQGRAVSCDVFCEQGVFTADQSRRDPPGGGRLRAGGPAPRRRARPVRRRGARGGARRACPPTTSTSRPTRGIAALAAAAGTDNPTVATLLPGTTWFLMAGDAAPARRFIDAGVPVALGTDFNPGTSPNPNLPLVMTVACLEMRLSPAEALAAVTVNAAYAAGIGDSAGALEPGKLGDAVVWRARSVGEIPYWVGADLVDVVVKRGRIVYRRAD